MAEIKTLRATAAQMKAAATQLEYDFGTGMAGEVIFLGHWPSPLDADGDPDLPELPPVPTHSTPRQRRDHRFAESLRREQPKVLLKTLLACRQVIGDAIAAEIELRGEGYTDKALAKMLAKHGAFLLESIGGVIGLARNSSDRLAEIRRTLAGELQGSLDAGKFLKALDSGIADDDSEADKRGDTEVAVQTAIYDMAIVQMLKPLDPSDDGLVMERRQLPKQLDDPRVLAAIFRAPSALLPYTEDQMKAIAALAFERNWPKTAMMAGVVEAMLEQVRPVAGHALLLIGRLIDPANPYDAFRRVAAGGRWALEPMTEQSWQARTVYEDLCVYSRG